MSRTGSLFRREFKAFFETPVAYVFLVVFLVMTGFLTFFVSHYYEAGQADLSGFFIWIPWVYLVLVPAVTMRLWSEERRTGTIELLLTLPITTTQAVAAKFLAGWAFMILAQLLTLPLVATTMWLGDPDPGPIIGGYLGCIMLSGAMVSVGCVMSASTRNQVISFILSALVSLFLILAGWPPVTDMLAAWDPGWVIPFVAKCSVMPHYETMQRGVLDLRDGVYFISIILFMLAAAVTVINERKTV